MISTIASEGETASQLARHKKKNGGLTLTLNNALCHRNGNTITNISPTGEQSIIRSLFILHCRARVRYFCDNTAFLSTGASDN